MLTGGGREVPKKLEIPTYTFTNDAAANFTNLKLIARTSGGEFFNLNEKFVASEIVSRIGNSSYGFLSVDTNLGEFGEMYVAPFLLILNSIGILLFIRQ